MSALRLHEAVAQVCPIDGISVGAPGDRSTWIVSFGAAATDQQKAAAASVIQSFSWDLTLPEVKSAQKKLVDDAAERCRLKYITGGSAKAMEYLEAKDQAVAVIQMGEAAANALTNHGAAEFPVLAASVPIEAATLHAAATLVMQRYEAYAAVAGVIKRKTIEAKAEIEAAQTVGEAQSVLGAIAWP